MSFKYEYCDEQYANLDSFDPSDLAFPWKEQDGNGGAETAGGDQPLEQYIERTQRQAEKLSSNFGWRIVEVGRRDVTLWGGCKRTGFKTYPCLGAVVRPSRRFRRV